MIFETDLSKLEQRFLLPLPGKEAQFRLAPSFRPSMDESGAIQEAGVIILLYYKNNELHFPLIERPVYNGAHSGQISFPGGKTEATDKSIIDTALRECNEEIGVNASKIKVLGNLTNLIIPISKFEVHPVVGYWEGTISFSAQPEEVVSIIEVPLSAVLSETTLEYKKVIYEGIEGIIPFFNVCDKMVWGATAMILSEFIHIWNETF